MSEFARKVETEITKYSDTFVRDLADDRDGDVAEIAEAEMIRRGMLNSDAFYENR